LAAAESEALGAMAAIPTIDEKEAQTLSDYLAGLLPANWVSAQIAAKFADGHDTATFSYKDASDDVKILDPGFDVFDESMQIFSAMREASASSGHKWTQVVFSVLPHGQFKFEYGYGPVRIF
jgi:hypothetical protein